MANRKNKKEKYNPDIIYFDTSKTYSIPMLRPNVIRHLDNEERVNCKIEQNDKRGAVRAYAEGYQDKWFLDNYFDWLIYTGYVKIID